MLVFRSGGVQVAVVRADSTIAMTRVLLGRDFGNEVEVLDGVGADSAVVVSPPDSLVDKQAVRVSRTGTGAPKGQAR